MKRKNDYYQLQIVFQTVKSYFAVIMTDMKNILQITQLIEQYRSMVNTNEIEKILNELGFTKYETKITIELYSRGSLKADELSS